MCPSRTPPVAFGPAPSASVSDGESRPLLPEHRNQRVSVWGWNGGGAELSSLPKVIMLQREDLATCFFCKWYLGMSGDGSTTIWQGGKSSHTERRTNGGEPVVDGACFGRCIQIKKASWYKLQHLERPLELRVGIAHFTLGFAVAQYEDELHDHFQRVPRNAHGEDVNTHFGWRKDRDGVTKDGKGNIFHKALVERGLAMGVPSPCQFRTPTSRPRQAARHGQCIDVMAFGHMRLFSWQIHVGSHLTIGADHELCESCFVLSQLQESRKHGCNAGRPGRPVLPDLNIP